MAKTIYVGNLPYQTTENELKELFEEYGEVSSTKIITDRETGRSRGFGFVEIDEQNAQKAIDSLNGASFGGRNLKVNEAREKKPRRF